MFPLPDFGPNGPSGSAEGTYDPKLPPDLLGFDSPMTLPIVMPQIQSERCADFDGQELCFDDEVLKIQRHEEKPQKISRKRPYRSRVPARKVKPCRRIFTPFASLQTLDLTVRELRCILSTPVVANADLPTSEEKSGAEILAMIVRKRQ
jgi:hypothetical protein